MFNIGDKISVLDDDFEGVVIGFKNKEITIETKDGFMMNFSEKELVKINNTNELDSASRNFNSHQIKREKEIEKSKHVVKEKKKQPEMGVPEFDLHIEKLVKNHRGMSNYDILTLQTETAKRHIEFAIKNRIPKIVFIHGVGEGILKAELDFMFGRYENLTFTDANYQKYGLGATEIYFKQNVKV
jgi:hypothetical protein